MWEDYGTLEQRGTKIWKIYYIKMELTTGNTCKMQRIKTLSNSNTIALISAVIVY